MIIQIVIKMSSPGFLKYYRLKIESMFKLKKAISLIFHLFRMCSLNKDNKVRQFKVLFTSQPRKMTTNPLKNHFYTTKIM